MLPNRLRLIMGPNHGGTGDMSPKPGSYKFQYLIICPPNFKLCIGTPASYYLCKLTLSIVPKWEYEKVENFWPLLYLDIIQEVYDIYDVFFSSENWIKQCLIMKCGSGREGNWIWKTWFLIVYCPILSWFFFWKNLLEVLINENNISMESV